MDLGTSIVIATLVWGVFVLGGLWRIFTKAGESGWAIFVPLYNYWVMVRISGLGQWWFLLWCLPGLGLLFPDNTPLYLASCGLSLFVSMTVQVSIGRQFGKNDFFNIGMALLPMIFWPILGFGNARYHGSRS